jgi:PKHD-type hydroxylase
MRLHYDRADALSGEECDAAIALADEAAMAMAPVYGGGFDYVPPDRVRRVGQALRTRENGPDWLFDRLDALFAEAAEALGVEVAPMAEPVQILRYGPGDHFQAWHTDAGIDRVDERLLSVSIELSDPGDHEGGALEILPDLVGRGRTLKRGGARLFFSRGLHRVTPVTRGVRWAIVNWTPPARRTSAPA